MKLLSSVLSHCFVKSVLTQNGFGYFVIMRHTEIFFMVDFINENFVCFSKTFSQQLGIYLFL